MVHSLFVKIQRWKQWIETIRPQITDVLNADERFAARATAELTHYQDLQEQIAAREIVSTRLYGNVGTHPPTRAVSLRLQKDILQRLNLFSQDQDPSERDFIDLFHDLLRPDRDDAAPAGGEGGGGGGGGGGGSPLPAAARPKSAARMELGDVVLFHHVLTSLGDAMKRDELQLKQSRTNILQQSNTANRFMGRNAPAPTSQKTVFFLNEIIFRPKFHAATMMALRKVKGRCGNSDIRLYDLVHNEKYKDLFAYIVSRNIIITDNMNPKSYYKKVVDYRRVVAQENNALNNMKQVLNPRPKRKNHDFRLYSDNLEPYLQGYDPD
jgi:hypothetical protein